MADLDREKKIPSNNLRGNLRALDDVTFWRKPDVTFSEHAKIDLGGIEVELWYFGPGNAPGDTVVRVRDAKVAWTGNYLMAPGVPPMLLEGGTGPYIDSLERLKTTLDIETIVPGHGPMGPAKPAVDNFLAYPRELHERVRSAIADGLDVDGAIEAYPSSPLMHPPSGVTPDPEMKAMAPHLHRLNVMAEYRALTRH
jgi:cyclase